MVSTLVKRMLYASGALGAFHRIRNTGTLTVAMFHRVLDTRDPRWPGCDPAYALTLEQFRQALDFFQRHYAIVSLDDVLESSLEARRLPSCALLVTFDDGWADTAEYAAPELRRRRMPAVVFVAADAIGAEQPFYQERIVAAWRTGRVDASRLRGAVEAVGGHLSCVPAGEMSEVREIVRAVEALDPASRSRFLEALDGPLSVPGRAMVTAADIARLEEAGIAIGAHGSSHEPLTSPVDLDRELGGARASIAGASTAMAPPSTMSFPHGRHSPEIVEAAHRAGYSVVFTSEPRLNPTRPGLGTVLGRVGFESQDFADGDGRLRAERLALYLFRRPHARRT